MSKNPDFPRGYFRKASAMRQLDNIEEAIALLKTAPEKIQADESIKKLLEELGSDLKIDNVLPKDHPEIIRFNKFVKWLKEGGANFDKIKMRYYSPDYRGVHARTHIKKNEVFLTIPKNLIITLEMAKAAPIGAKMEKAKLNLLSPKHSFLASYVLQERHKTVTKWEPYLDILPKSTSNFPIFFTTEEKKWLEGSPFLNQVEEKIADVAKDYNTIVTAVPEFTQYTLEEFSHIRMLVSSRIFGITVDGKKTDSLVPLADMLNHKRPQQTSWEYSEKRSGFIIEAKESIERGEQVYDSYGKKCNSRFFLNYGFIVENNDANEVPIKIQLDEGDELYTAKQKLINYSDPKTIRVSEDLAEKNMMDFFSYLRFAEFRGDPMVLYKCQFQQSSRKKSDEDEDYYETYKGTNVPPLSIENETDVLQRIQKLAESQLKKYPTTLEEDQKILETNKSLDFNQRNCVLMRSGEKSVLKFLIRLVQIGLELIAMPLKKAKDHFGKMPDRDAYDKYVTMVLFPLMLSSGK